MNRTDWIAVGLVLLVLGLVFDAVGPVPAAGMAAFWVGLALLMRGLWLAGQAVGGQRERPKNSGTP
ncbi:hypothetical protein OOJ91_11965 [Micromonospora lupini]|uniref:hypothetical protein n=1 Tax=Micromonospora lupini TaxID=285679 RepID=UPI00225058AB|nr:hypothetical protein [Micromonospora lupini]MCX5066593.1 hypothetical protein [Micromonospora lupini]